jgi:hypothetical protein
MTVTPLAVELTNPIYADLSDEDAAAAVNAKRVSVRRPVPTWRIKLAAIEGGYYAGLVLAERAGNPLAISVLSWIDDPSIQTCDMDLPSVQFMLAGLVSASLVTQPQADALDALANAQIPWSESVGIYEVIGAGLVHNARLEIASDA